MCRDPAENRQHGWSGTGGTSASGCLARRSDAGHHPFRCSGRLFRVALRRGLRLVQASCLGVRVQVTESACPPSGGAGVLLLLSELCGPHPYFVGVGDVSSV